MFAVHFQKQIQFMILSSVSWYLDGQELNESQIPFPKQSLCQVPDFSAQVLSLSKIVQSSPQWQQSYPLLCKDNFVSSGPVQPVALWQ